MAFALYSIDEAVDCKYVVMKSLSGQAKAGTVIHVMDTNENSEGIRVDYRVTKTGQNFVIKFPTIKEFCKWCRPDSFVARHYDSFTRKEIMNYLKVKDRSFTTFTLPIIIAALVVIWLISMLAIGGGAGVGVGIALSIVAALGIMYITKTTKEKMLVKLYGKVNTGISFK